MAKFTTAHYSAIISTVALIASGASLYVGKLSYDLGAAKSEREIEDKMPAVDIEIRPRGASVASLVISIINRSDINIAPLSLTVEHSIEAGELYLSSAQQSLDNLQSTLDLKAMGTIAPNGTGTLEATLAGATDGKWDSLTPGLELEFTVRIRLADQQDTIQQRSIVRRILPPLADRLRPTPDMFITAVKEAEKARRNQRLYFVAQISSVLLVSFMLISCLLRLWRMKVRKPER